MNYLNFFSKIIQEKKKNAGVLRDFQHLFLNNDIVRIMCPAPYTDHILHRVVPGIAVGLEITVEALQKLLRILLPSVILVLIQHYGMLCRFPRPVQPHEAVRLGRLSRLPQDLQLGLIRMDDVLLYQLLLQGIIHRLQPICRTSDQPVGHGLPG